MEIKTLVAIQLAFDLLLGAAVLWCLWGGRDAEAASAARLDAVVGLQEQMTRWETSGEAFLGVMKGRLQELGALGEELERAQVRASETLDRLEQVQAGWGPRGASYGQAKEWIREGVPPEEVARRTGFGVDEVRLIQGLAPAVRRAH
jgi:hypothetical protein